MSDAVHHPRLAHEPGQHLPRAGQLPPHHLDGGAPAQHAVGGQVDGPVAAAGHQPVHQVVADRIAGREVVRRVLTRRGHADGLVVRGHSAET
jgi:hypothetical protein